MEEGGDRQADDQEGQEGERQRTQVVRTQYGALRRTEADGTSMRGSAQAEKNENDEEYRRDCPYTPSRRLRGGRR